VTGPAGQAAPPEHPLTLWVLRHAKAVHDPPAGGTDHERSLTRRGRRDASALGRRLGQPGDRLGFDERSLPRLVLSSTAARAAQTAEQVAAGLPGVPVVHRRSLYGAAPEEILAELRTLDVDGPVMVVGHNPSAEGLVSAMSSRGPGGDKGSARPVKLATCALAVLELTVASWSEVHMGSASLLARHAPPY